MRVLVFTRTTGYRHDSIGAGIEMVRDLGAAHGFAVDATEDATLFTDLDRYAAVVFLSTTGDVLDGGQHAAFESYIGAGGGYVGVHSAAATEYEWPFYGRLVGAWFDSHPEVQTVTVRTEDPAHPATAHLPPAWERVDEAYNYRRNPRADVRVLSTLDESTYGGGTMGADHPITWCHEYGGGRAFHTGLGHTTESYADPAFQTMILGGIRYAAGPTT
jgi:type 1 glutamine amidotransferase